MPGRTIQFEGKSYSFPDDATDDEISQALAASSGQPDPRAQINQGSVSGPEPGIGGAINRGIAAVKGWLGGNKPEPGSGSRAVDLLGGPILGPMHMAHGATMTDHPVRGLNEVIRGGAQTLALPLSVVAPSAIPSSLPYAAGGAGVSGAARYLGADPDTAELAGNVAMGAAAGREPLARGTGSLLKQVNNLPDLPTNIPMSPKTNMLMSAMNQVKSGTGSVGRRMANVGRPPISNVAPGDGSSTYTDPDLPSIRPDGAGHYNDVVDQGETNRLLDSISQYDGHGRPSPDSVQPSGQSHYNDVPTPIVPGDPYANTLMPDDRSLSQRIMESQGQHHVPTADETPTPMSDTLLRAIQSAPGWPENGLPDKPWDVLHRESELPDALATDPYNRPPDRSIQSPSYVGPERRSIGRGEGEVLPPEYDAFDEGMGHGAYDPSLPSRNIPENLVIEGRPTPKGLPPGLAETTAASDPEGDMDALSQARQELPSGSLSDHLQRAAQIAANKREPRGLVDSPIPNRFKPIILKDE